MFNLQLLIPYLLATYLAGGGLAGFGVWAADKMLFGGEIIGSLFDNVIEITLCYYRALV